QIEHVMPRTAAADTCCKLTPRFGRSRLGRNCYPRTRQFRLTPFVSTRRFRSALVVSTIVAFSVPTVTIDAQAPKPFEALSRSAQSMRDSVVQMARAQVGKRYRTGGQSPERGFDCSGLIAYVMAKLNLQVPRTARLQAKEGLAVSKDTALLLPGD